MEALTVRTADGPLFLVARAPVPADRAYVASAMLGAVRRHARYTHGRAWRALADRTMALWDEGPESAPLRLVLHLPEDPGLIVAFMIGDPTVPLLHFLNVRPSFRRKGIARALMEAALGSGHGVPTAVTLMTDDLVREAPARGLPTGLLNNPNWRLTPVPRDD